MLHPYSFTVLTIHVLMCAHGAWGHAASQRNNKYYTVRPGEPQRRSSKRYPEETDPRNGLSWGSLKGTEGSAVQRLVRARGGVSAKGTGAAAWRSGMNHRTKEMTRCNG